MFRNTYPWEIVYILRPKTLGISRGSRFVAWIWFLGCTYSKGIWDWRDSKDYQSGYAELGIRPVQ